MRGLPVETKLMHGLRRLQVGVAKIFNGLGGNLARSNVYFLLRERSERSLWQPEISRQNLGRSAGDPVGDAKGAELREMAVVETQQEMALLGTQSLQRVAVPAGEIPGVAGLEFGNLRLAVWRDHCSAAAAGENVGPFRRQRVPVQLPNRARLQAHRNSGDALRHGKLRRRRFLGRTCGAHPPFLILDVELEV